MSKAIEKVGVLGAGVMGTGIACHMANAGLEVVLLDIVPPAGGDNRNLFAERALEAAKRHKPAPLFHPRLAARIQTGNLEDHLDRLASCQWVIEAVKEDLGIKQELFSRVEKVVGPGTIVSSNTSGLPLKGLVQGRSEEFQKHFLITHFFNPARYMRLLELVLGPKTDAEAAKHIERFAKDVLGKGVVYGKDTPNFVANRIGAYGIMRCFKEMKAQKASVEEIDAIFGPAIGRPKSAVFKTADIVGIDVLSLVAEHCYEGLPDDPERSIYEPPQWLKDMVAAGQLGRKAKSGFYKKVPVADDNPKGLLVWDIDEKKYRPLQKVRIDSLGAVKNEEKLEKRLQTVVFAGDRAGQIVWPVMRDTIAYAMRLVGEIADDVHSIDCAMRWGFSWDLGPFETWDALGFAEVAKRMKADGVELSPWVEELLSKGATSIYEGLGDKSGKKVDPGRIGLAGLKKAGAKVVKTNSSASLVDIGDGVFALEFHAKGNAIDADITKLVVEGIDWVEDTGARGMVIYNEGENFSFGANLMLIYMLAQSKEFGQIEEASRGMQQAMQRIRYARVPVLCAPHAMALGGGAEIVLAAASGAGVRPNSELYMGLVEVGVGLIPGGAGTMNAVFAMLDSIPEGVQVDSLPYVAKAFEQIAMAKVSTSAVEAKSLGYLPKSTTLTMDRSRLLHDAKSMVLGLSSAGYRPPERRAFKLPGESGIATINTQIKSMVDGGFATAHDALIAKKLAHVLCGGVSGHSHLVTEEEMLDLEREAFVSLCGEEKSQARMASILTTNKPLRN